MVIIKCKLNMLQIMQIDIYLKRTITGYLFQIYHILFQAWGQVHGAKYKYKYSYLAKLQVQVLISRVKYKYFEKLQVQVLL